MFFSFKSSSISVYFSFIPPPFLFPCGSSLKANTTKGTELVLKQTITILAVFPFVTDEHYSKADFYSTSFSPNWSLPRRWKDSNELRREEGSSHGVVKKNVLPFFLLNTQWSNYDHTSTIVDWIIQLMNSDHQQWSVKWMCQKTQKPTLPMRVLLILTDCLSFWCNLAYPVTPGLTFD